MSVGIVIKDPLPSTANPEPTADKRLAPFMDRIDWAQVDNQGSEDREHPKEIELAPALDTAALSRKYGMANAHKPVLKVGTFQVPLRINLNRWENYRRGAITKFLRGMSLQGWDVASDLRFPPGADTVPGVQGVYYEGQGTILVYPGIYPARDLRDQVPLLDRREYRVAAHFRFRNPQPKRILVTPDLLAPLVVPVGRAAVSKLPVLRRG